MRGWWAVVCGAIILEFSGCVTTSSVHRGMTLTAMDVLQHIKERDEMIRTLKGEGSITMESPEASGNGSFTVELKKPDSLRLELRGPFGIRIGTLAITSERYVYYDWREKRATVGAPDSASLRSILRIPLRFDEVMKAFTGQLFSIGAGDSLSAFSVQRDDYLMRFASSSGVREFYVQPDVLMIESYRRLELDEKPSLVAMASRYDSMSGIVMPQVVRVIEPRERRSVTIVYDDVGINVPVDPSFSIPSTAEVIYR